MQGFQGVEAFAMTAHKGQKRKNGIDDYIVHPLRVAERVREMGGDDDMVAAAILHDVVEDTKVTINRVEYLFGTRVARLVFELTNPKFPGCNRAERMRLEHRWLCRISPEAKLIKLADIEDNLSSVHDLDLKFARQYVREKIYHLSALRGGRRQLNYHRVMRLAYQKADELGVCLV